MPELLHIVTRAQRRGAEVAACLLNDRLGAWGWPGEVLALAPGHDGLGLDVHVLGATPRSPATLHALRHRSHGIPLLVAHGSATLWAAALTRITEPFVYVSIGDPRHWAPGRARRLRTRLALKRARAVVVVAPTAQRVVTDWYGLDPARVRVLPNFRSARRFRPPTLTQRRAARDALGLDVTDKVVLVLGSLTPEKRPVAAVSAALDVPGVHVVVAGDGPLRAAIDQLVARHPRRVTVTGTVDDPIPLLHAADSLLVASASEGLPGVLVEAGLCGIPATATDVGWISDVVDHGATGVLVPCPDGQAADDSALLKAAIERTLDERDKLGRAARLRCVTHFDDEVVTPRWTALLEELVPGAAR